MLWDFSKWPEYRSGHISGVLIREVPLYIVITEFRLCYTLASYDIVLTILSLNSLTVQSPFSFSLSISTAISPYTIGSVPGQYRWHLVCKKCGESKIMIITFLYVKHGKMIAAECLREKREREELM